MPRVAHGSTHLSALATQEVDGLHCSASKAAVKSRDRPTLWLRCMSGEEGGCSSASKHLRTTCGDQGSRGNKSSACCALKDWGEGMRAGRQRTCDTPCQAKTQGFPGEGGGGGGGASYTYSLLSPRQKPQPPPGQEVPAYPVQTRAPAPRPQPPASAAQRTAAAARGRDEGQGWGLWPKQERARRSHLQAQQQLSALFQKRRVERIDQRYACIHKSYSIETDTQ
jgi:hypothetical protein